ncbi:MAG: hypothetical protein WC560_12865 [Syntrophales bacterium]
MARPAGVALEATVVGRSREPVLEVRPRDAVPGVRGRVPVAVRVVLGVVHRVCGPVGRLERLVPDLRPRVAGEAPSGDRAAPGGGCGPVAPAGERAG